MHKPLRFLLKLLIHPIALLCTMVGIGWYLATTPRLRTGCRLLRLVMGAEVQTMLAKFGDLRMYLLHEVRGGTERVVTVNVAGGNTLVLDLTPRVRLCELRRRERWDFLHCLRLLLFLLGKIKQHRLNLVHANEPYLYGVVGWLTARLSGLPFCVSLHADYEKRESLQPGSIPRAFGSLALARRLERFTYRHADRILPIRASMIPHIEACGGEGAKIRVFPHGMDLSPFADSGEFHARFAIPPQGRIVSSLGRVERDNYCDDLLAVARFCLESGVDAYFVFAGAGTQWERMRRETAAAGLEERIVWPGAVEQGLGHELRRRSAVNLCLMAGFSLIEACAAGRPVIAYDVEWHHELVQSGETGYLAAEGDVTAVAAHIRWLLEHPGAAAAMGEAARERAFARHSLAAVDAVKAEIYREMLHE